ncbi:hypothetical protein ACFW35_12930 [Fictibacillus sp. NPDC058756]|uniref:hypothetical protein n=1 Tax=Fictibacillus sp. NPDC058756 TaxID=3346625 RepID=UPI0036C6383F
MLIIKFYFVNHFPSMLMDILAFIVIGVLAYRIYKKQKEKPKKEKAFIVIIVGLFSFSITMPGFDAFVKIPILPLGVWILYFIYRNKVEKWVKYRRFAWLGFIANFIFLAATFMSIPIQNTLYPENEITTYIANKENIQLIKLHPSARDAEIKKEVLNKQLSNMNRKTIDSDEWYQQIEIIDVPNERVERFPYQLAGTKPKWGSALNNTVYIEKDGKGLLITTPEKQIYYRSEETLLSEGVTK